MNFIQTLILFIILLLFMTLWWAMFLNVYYRKGGRNDEE